MEIEFSFPKNKSSLNSFCSSISYYINESIANIILNEFDVRFESYLPIPFMVQGMTISLYVATMYDSAPEGTIVSFNKIFPNFDEIITEMYYDNFKKLSEAERYVVFSEILTTRDEITEENILHQLYQNFLLPLMDVLGERTNTAEYKEMFKKYDFAAIADEIWSGSINQYS